MSMVQCERCDKVFDSDDDPDCFVEKANYAALAHPVGTVQTQPIEYECICEPCRDELADELDEAGLTD